MDLFVLRDDYSVTGIFSTLRWWRPPSNGVEKNLVMISSASWLVTKRPGITSTLASLCWRASPAISAVQHNAARMPWCLFSVIFMPFPLPQIAMPG